MDPGAVNPIASCPVCGAHGAIGQPCTTKRCQRRGYHFIPQSYLNEDDVVDGIIGQRWGDFLIVRRVTEGGVGAIYLALQMPVMMKAAVKILANDAPASLADRLQHEATALARLSHPNIVRLLKYGEAARRAYMVMEYVEGGRTLADAMERHELDRAASLRVLRELIGALDAAHTQQVVHRDIKPQNVMLQRLPDNPNFVRLVDFGLVKFTDTGRESTVIAAGTPTYMAPEQISRQGIGPWTDWYAVAMLAAEMLLGHRPFANIATDEVIHAKLRPDFDPTTGLAGRALAAPVLAFFRQALANDPLRRMRTTAAFRDGFELMAAALPPEAAPRPVAPSGPHALVARQPIDRASLIDSIRAIPDPEDFDPDSTMRSDDGAKLVAGRPRKKQRSDLDDDEPTQRSRVWPAEAPVTEKGLLADRVPTSPLQTVSPEDEPTAMGKWTAPAATGRARTEQPATVRPGAQRAAASQLPASGAPARSGAHSTPAAAVSSEAPPAARRPTGREHGAAGPARVTTRANVHGAAAAASASASSSLAPASAPASMPIRRPQQREKTLLVDAIRDDEATPPPAVTNGLRNLLIVMVLLALGVLGAVVWLMLNPPSSRAATEEPESRVIVE